MQESNQSSNDTMSKTLELQKAAHIAAGVDPAEVRIDRLKRAINVLENNSSEFCECDKYEFEKVQR